MEKAKILEQLIKKSGYTVRAFAKKCGIPESTLYTILKNGVGRAAMDNILIICKNLGIKVEDLDAMAKGLEKAEPTYDDLQYLIARNGKNLSTEEKMNLIKMLSEL
ncbi:MAG: helix-turn-helix transcriptional regulator [Lachnospiraceae bacterium]|jgi:predicted transcriptional regulator|nr:helix-turn-helix transcriptional regulator [Lachnospiraceae bacterium]